MILNREKLDFTERRYMIPGKEEDVYAERNVVILDKRK
jgi:hypothetical protein